MRNIKIIPAVAIILMLFSCSISTFGKFQADEGVPPFIPVGETTRTEVLKTLGEPLDQPHSSGQRSAYLQS